MSGLRGEVDALIEQCRLVPSASGPGFEAKAALLVHVVVELLGSEDPKNVAPLTRQARELIAELVEGLPREGAGSPFGSDLPAKVRDAAQPGPGDVGRGRGGGGGAVGPAADGVATPRSRRRP